MDSVSNRQLSKRSGYYVIDAEGALVNQTPFATERKATEAMHVYEDNCSDVVRPLRVIKGNLTGDQCSVCRHWMREGEKYHEHPCE